MALKEEEPVAEEVDPLPVVLNFNFTETTGLPVFSPQHYFGSAGGGDVDVGDDFLTPSKR